MDDRPHRRQSSRPAYGSTPTCSLSTAVAAAAGRAASTPRCARRRNCRRRKGRRRKFPLHFEHAEPRFRHRRVERGGECQRQHAARFRRPDDAAVPEARRVAYKRMADYANPSYSLLDAAADWMSAATWRRSLLLTPNQIYPASHADPRTTADNTIRIAFV